MKCPLFGMYDHERHGNEVSTAPDCLQHECHWWSQKYGRCAILGYLEAWERLNETLKNISSKLPLGGAK